MEKVIYNTEKEVMLLDGSKAKLIVKIVKNVEPVFNEKDIEVFGRAYYNRRHIEKVEQFFVDHSDIYDWESKEARVALHPGMDFFPTDYVYVDSNGNIFQSLAAMNILYGVDVEHLAMDPYGKADKIEIKEFNSSDGKIFWHLNFNDANGNKVGVIRTFRCSVCEDHCVKEWESITDPNTIYSQRLHRFLDYATYVMYAVEHLND